MNSMPYRWPVIGLLLFIAIGALPAGYGFLGTPDGSAVAIPEGWINDTPFTDYTIPGALLFGLGVLHLAAAYYEFRRDGFAPWITETAGVGMIIWIVVQAAMMGSFRHPIQTALQAICISVGVFTAIVGYIQIRAQLRTAG